MSKRRKWTLVIVVVAVAVSCLTVWITREPQPSYNGKSLSEWLEVYRVESSDQAAGRPASNDGADAIRAIGTNALPWLLRKTSFEPPTSSARGTIGRLLLKLPKLSHSRGSFVGWTKYYPEVSRAAEVTKAFTVLGTNANPAIPELVRRLNDTNAPTAANCAIYALASMGESATPILLAHLANTNAPYRALVVRAFSWWPAIATNNQDFVWQLITCLSDSDPQVQHFSALALQVAAQHTQPQPDTVVPAIMKHLQRPLGHNARAALVAALHAYGEKARDAVPVLQRMLNDPHDWVRFQVTNALMRIAPEILTNGPAK